MKAMKWLTGLAVVTLLAGLAGAEMTAVATWNDGPSTDPGWIDRDYGAWSAEPGFDWINWADGPGDAVSCLTFGRMSYPDSNGVGKWGGGLKDDVGLDGGMYVTVNNDPYPTVPAVNRAVWDKQGTIEFWFKPLWDPNPALQIRQHSLIYVNSVTAAGDGLFIRWNGDGTVTTQMRTLSFWEGGPDVEVGHEWTSTSLVNDWNHVAFVWDQTGNKTYCNGRRVGETIYDGPDAPKVQWNDYLYVMLGQEANISTDYQSDAIWDSMAIWDEVRYSGPTYTMPTEEFQPPSELLGDLNEDGFVGQADLDIVLAMWGESGAGITDLRADANEDAFGGQTDLDYVLANWGKGTPLTAVPEPVSLWLLGLGGLVLRARRRVGG